ncbi:MAG: O-antigen ligase family protein [Bacteriovoracaceae bacterium]
MNKLMTAALFFLAAGIFTSVTILSAYQILFVIAATYFTYLAIKEENYKIPKSAWALLAFSFVAFLSTTLNFDVIDSPGKSYGRIKYYLMGVATIFAMRYYLKSATEKTLQVLIHMFLLSMVVASGYCLYQRFFLGYDRASALTETMRYGYGTGMVLTILLGIVLRPKILNFVNRPFLITAMIFGLLGVWATLTRGAMLGFVCAVPFSIFFGNKKAGIIVGIVAILVVGTLGGIYLFGTGDYGSRFVSTKNNGSDTIRRSQWQAAYIAWKEKPILGWGLSNFSSQLKRIKVQYDLDHKEYNNAHSHNILLETASGTGLLGLLCFVAWLGLWAFEMWTGPAALRGLIVPFGVAMIISGQFEVILDANNSSLIMFVYGLSVVMRERLQKVPATF